METKEIIKHVLKDYQNIIGLRNYVAYDNAVVQSASGKNYFCKCLKPNSKALKGCEECTEGTYENARKIDHERVHSCHTGLTKWVVPIQRGDFHCVIADEGVLTMKQMEDTGKWAEYLSGEYQPDKNMPLRNSKVIQTMDEGQMNTSIKLLKGLLSCCSAIAGEQA